MPTDLDVARSQSTINVAALGHELRDASQREIRARVLPIIEREPIFQKSSKPFLNHTQHLLRSLSICKRLLELRDEHGWRREELMHAIMLQDDSMPMTLHEGAFAVVVESQGSDEQRALWMPRIARYEVTGCYAQTELAHGSNVQGLETTAVFDRATQEFVVNSPRIESTKWWIGGLGIMANHALVQAILQLPQDDKGTLKSYGPHLFLVPIRDLHTHEPLPGVAVGDIGPKAMGGFRATDNGYLNLTMVRIPRANMLMRHAKLTADGAYVPAAHDKLSYGSMVTLRCGIPVNLGWQLARAVTIAVRYCTARRQFSADRNGTATTKPEELQVLQYASTKHRLYPLVAQAYAYIAAGREMQDMYASMMAKLAQDDVSLLAEVHALSTALKAKSTWDCVRGIEEARKTMGGHGYSYMSGVGHIFANTTPAQTFEGDNYVISQQIARSLLKHLAALQSGASASTLPASCSYLSTALPPSKFATQNNGVQSLADWCSPTHQLAALYHRACWLVLQLADAITHHPSPTSTTSSSSSTTTSVSVTHSWLTSKIAAAHADVFVAHAFRRRVDAAPPALQEVLRGLCDMHVLGTLAGAGAELVEAGAVDRVQLGLLRRAAEEQVEALDIPDAVALTDAFGFSDFELGAVLGRGDGKVYEEMWRAAREVDVGRGESSAELRAAALEIVTHYRKTDKKEMEKAKL